MSHLKTKIKIYKIELFYVMHGYETWSPTLMDGVKMSENKRMMRIFGPNRTEKIE
jgi:hypothetical protein